MTRFEVRPGPVRRQRASGMERREAQHPITRVRAPSHGARRPDRKGPPKGAVAQRPGASRRSIPSSEGRKKGNAHPAHQIIGAITHVRTSFPRIALSTSPCLRSRPFSRMIPKSGYRFSEKIMHKRKLAGSLHGS